MAEQSIIVRHNVEMGHRLSLQPDSKCFQLHGHSWWVDLELTGNVDSKGMVLGLDFGHVKKIWRAYLDTNFDHHLCLNGTDPLVGMIIMSVPPHAEAFESDDDPQLVVARDILKDWGITIMSMDPTVENMARVWGMWAAKTFQSKVAIKVNEAATNAATWRSY